MAVEPRDILLTAADLPPGFAISPDLTQARDPIDNIGSMYQIRMLARAINGDLNLLARFWLFVLQLIVRLESALGAGDALQLQRNCWITQFVYQPSNAGPNDGGTFSLAKTDDGVTIYPLGFIKENMIIITVAGGIHGIVSYAGGARAGVVSRPLAWTMPSVANTHPPTAVRPTIRRLAVISAQPWPAIFGWPVRTRRLLRAATISLPGSSGGSRR